MSPKPTDSLEPDVSPKAATPPETVCPTKPTEDLTPDEAIKPIAELAKAVKELSVAKKCVLPNRWEDDPDDPGRGIENHLADCFGQDGIGIRGRVDSSSDPRLQTYGYASLSAAGDELSKVELDAEFVTMERRGDEQNHLMTRGLECIPVEMIHVPKEEVAALEMQDLRPRVPGPMDVVTTDNPAADTNRYLQRGNDFMRRNWANGKWSPGDLLGPNGSDPETKAQSPSYAKYEDWVKTPSERRSATSAGHIHAHPRPAGVSLGWGGYDKFTHWQSHGRQIKKDMVEDEEWSKDLLAPIIRVNEAGEVLKIIETVIDPEDLPQRPREPMTLYELLNNSKKDKKPQQQLANPT
ncbi:hypothetical protein S40288_05880 [Stachybotrys chartarum IBT 40288]|nr:hypothetical protein S40288_05880 [Stachybotrys chartarum IBT 40288]